MGDHTVLQSQLLVRSISGERCVTKKYIVRTLDDGMDRRKVISIACGGDSCFSLRSDGCIWAWGLGFGSIIQPVQVTVNTPIIKVMLIRSESMHSLSFVFLLLSKNERFPMHRLWDRTHGRGRRMCTRHGLFFENKMNNALRLHVIFYPSTSIVSIVQGLNTFVGNWPCMLPGLL